MHLIPTVDIYYVNSSWIFNGILCKLPIGPAKLSNLNVYRRNKAAPSCKETVGMATPMEDDTLQLQSGHESLGVVTNQGNDPSLTLVEVRHHIHDARTTSQYLLTLHACLPYKLTTLLLRE